MFRRANAILRLVKTVYDLTQAQRFTRQAYITAAALGCNECFTMHELARSSEQEAYNEFRKAVLDYDSR